jgi:hypothetical protein
MAAVYAIYYMYRSTFMQSKLYAPSSFSIMRSAALGQVLRNMLAVMRLLAVAKPAAASAGLDLLLVQRREQGIRVTETPMTQQQVCQDVQHMHVLGSSNMLTLQQALLLARWLNATCVLHGHEPTLLKQGSTLRGSFAYGVDICCGPQAHLEVQAAWDCMQKELQRLVTELLGTSASVSHSASGN